MNMLMVGGVILADALGAAIFGGSGDEVLILETALLASGCTALSILSLQ